MLRKLLQELSAELQEDRSQFSRASKAAEVRKAGIGPPPAERPQEVLPGSRLSGRLAAPQAPRKSLEYLG